MFCRLKTDIIQSPEHIKLSLLAAMKSIVLLKNDDNALPMDELDKICVRISFLLCLTTSLFCHDCRWLGHLLMP